MARLYKASLTQADICQTALATAVPLTLEAVVLFTTAITADSYIIGLGQSGANGSMFNLYVRSTAAVRANAQNDAFVGSAATSTATVKVGKPTHIAAVLSANNSRSVYVDGGNKVTDTTSISAGTVNRTLIGAGMEAGAVVAHADCIILAANIWNVALTDGEILALANGKPPWEIQPLNLRSSMLPDSTGPTLFDHRGNIFTPTNAPLFVPPVPAIQINTHVPKWLNHTAAPPASRRVFVIS